MPRRSNTARQGLADVFRALRATMRRDRGLSGSFDRLATLSWILLLKLVDDTDGAREAAQWGGAAFVPTIQPPYRWRDWAARRGGLRGEALKQFVDGAGALRPDGTRGPALLAALRDPSTAGALAPVFRDLTNRMESAELLGAVLDQIDGVCFTDPEQRAALCHLYEALLMEMHSAGSAGEFYTPRPIVRFMVAALNPRLGEVVEDVAAGSGGFLVEAYARLARQCQTPEDHLALQTWCIRGGDAKPLPLLMATLNLMLHGLEAPRLAYGNALRGASAPEMADVLLTNPPFGGREDVSGLGAPEGGAATSDTALLLLQLLARKLRRPGGRASVVVLNGTLFAGGAAARVRECLLTTCNLHMIVRLPSGAFAPYSDVPANILFLDAAGPTREVWFYEMPPPQGRQRYTKTNPVGDAAFADCLAWWHARAQHARAWRVPFPEIAADGYNLDRKNPYRAIGAPAPAPLQIADSVLQKEHRIIDLLSEIKALLRDAA